MLASAIRKLITGKAHDVSPIAGPTAAPSEDKPAPLSVVVPLVTANAEDLDPRLYTGNPAYIKRFVLELTGKCNLRCVYCPQAGENFVPTETLSEGMFEDILTYLKRHPIDMIDLTGTGDAIMDPDWASRSERLMALGIKLALTMNFSKVFTDAEVETLSKFYELTVSLDTLDKKILAEVRKAVDVRTIVYNMMRVKAAQIRNNTSVRWVISAVYTAEIVERLPELASFAAAFGVTRFGIQDAIEFNGYGVVNKITSVWLLKGEEAVAAVDATKKALEYVADRLNPAHLPPQFSERLEELRQAALARSNYTPVAEKTTHKHIGTYSPVPESGFTRDCNDPWTFMHFLSDGRIRPCCISNLSIGDAKKGPQSIEAAHNGEVAIKLRKELLTGNLDEICSVCTLRPTIDLAQYRQKITDLTAETSEP